MNRLTFHVLITGPRSRRHAFARCLAFTQRCASLTAGSMSKRVKRRVTMLW